MTRIGIFYGSSTEATADVSESMAEKLAIDEHVFDVANLNTETMMSYDVLLCGISTWNIGDPQEDWAYAMDYKLKDVDFTGKTVALFGLGDAVGYPESYQDAIAILRDFLKERGASFIGLWSTEGYDFEESKAVEDDTFMGLALDNDNEDDLTEERIDAWLTQIKSEMASLV